MKLKDILNLLSKISTEKNISKPYICGGAVRDKAIISLNPGKNIDLSKSFQDLDITTGDSTIHNLAKEFAISLKDYKIAEKKADDGHTSVFIGKLKIDFSSNFIVPEIEKRLLEKNIKNPTNLQKEMFSRDFTCNSLLMDLNLKDILDPTNQGINDIKNKILRTCLDPDTTFRYNTNRIVRVIYMASKLDFEIDPEIIKWIENNKDLINKSTVKYLSKNIDKSLSYNADKTVELINQLKLWKYIPITKNLQPYYKKYGIFEKTSQLFTNYDYANMSSGPGSGLYTNLDKYKSVSDFRKKRRNKRKKILNKIKKNEIQMKKIIKLAVIRKDDEENCPFGLPIPYACKKVGDAVNEMTAGDDAKNKEIFLTQKTNSSCKFASVIFCKQKSVNCSYPNKSENIPTLSPSEFYSKLYGYNGYEGAQSYPMEYYEGWIGEHFNDNTINPYYGIYNFAKRQEYIKIRKEMLLKLKK